MMSETSGRLQLAVLPSPWLWVWFNLQCVKPC